MNFRSADCQAIMESCNDDNKLCSPCTNAGHILVRAEKKSQERRQLLIRFSLSLHRKSASTYRELRYSGALILPSERVFWV